VMTGDVSCGTDELTTNYEQLRRVRDELCQQLDTASRNEQIARVAVKATEQTNCALHFNIT